MKLAIKNEWSEGNFCHRYAITILDSQTFGLNYDRVIETTAKQRCKRRSWSLQLSAFVQRCCIMHAPVSKHFSCFMDEKTDRAQRQFALSFVLFYFVIIYFSPSFRTVCQIIKKIRANVFKTGVKMVFSVIKYTSIRFISISRFWMIQKWYTRDSILVCGKIGLFFSFLDTDLTRTVIWRWIVNWAGWICVWYCRTYLCLRNQWLQNAK